MDSIQIAKFFVLPSTFLISGYMTASSHNILPIISAQPASISTPIFAKVFYRGTSLIGPLSVMVTTAYGYLAYSAKTPRERRLYTAGAVLTLSVLPWTTLVMLKGINRLIHLSENSTARVKAEAVGEVTRLLGAWTTQNWFRATLVFSGGLVGLVASIS